MFGKMRRKVISVNFYPIWPALHGGQRRVFYLARELSKNFDVEIVTPDSDPPSRTLEFSPSLRETRIATEREFRRSLKELDDQHSMLSDLGFAMFWEKAEGFQAYLSFASQSADIIITEHPYSIFSVIAALSGRKVPIIYNAHNFEIEQKKSLIGSNDVLMQKAWETESTAVKEASLVVACSERDRQSLITEYDAEANKFKVVENGVDTNVTSIAQIYDNEPTLKRIKSSKRMIAVFGGSFHAPNLQSVDFILNAAKENREIIFILFGGICDYCNLKHTDLENVLCLGVISEEMRSVILSMSDFGLNPVEFGSGTNIKMFEYAAHGLTIVTSDFGARGIELVPGRDFVLTKSDELGATLRDISSTSELTKIHEMSKNAQEIVKKKYDWEIIGKRYQDEIRKILQY